MTDDAAGPAPGSRPIPPAVLLRPEPWDWYTLLVLWCLRQGSRVLLILGFIPPLLVGQLNNELPSRLDTPGEVLDALLSPLAFIAAAIVLRVAVAIVALFFAFPTTRNDVFDPRTSPPRTRAMLALDLLNLANGRRALRWSWAVRRTAALRLGQRGQALEMGGRALTWAVPVALIVVIAVAVVVT